MGRGMWGDGVPLSQFPPLCPCRYAAPFDRHDWIVDRCGTEVRYIVDFYNGSPTATKPVAIHIDARPALDSFGAAWDRVRRYWGFD